MTTEKQLIANQQNALASTGPVTIEGKAVVATNPIKHGIFTKNLLVASPLYQETTDDYLELLENLKNCFLPQNQMESLLVEKIAVDFWRLRRVLRFETGGIESYLESLFQSFYNYQRKPTSKLIEQMEYCKNTIAWINRYVVCLENNQVTFDDPVWKGDAISSDIVEDLYLIARSLPTLSYPEKEALPYTVHELLAVITKHGYTSPLIISKKLIELYAREKSRLERELEELKQKESENLAADHLHQMLGSLPQSDHSDKVLKHERSLQKSIYENLFLLKKLQGLF